MKFFTSSIFTIAVATFTFHSTDEQALMYAMVVSLCEVGSLVEINECQVHKRRDWCYLDNHLQTDVWHYTISFIFLVKKDNVSGLTLGLLSLLPMTQIEPVFVERINPNHSKQTFPFIKFV